jgi:hypothetical protein
VTAHERPSTLASQHQRERTIQRPVDRHGREDGSHHADRQGEGAPLHELVRDAVLLRGGRGIDVSKDLDEIALGSILPVDERENADEQGEEWNEREENLVRDRAREEGTVVRGEAHDDRSHACDGAG